jgi:hypothetical protein
MGGVMYEPSAVEWLIAYWILGSFLITVVVIIAVVIAMAAWKLCEAAYNEVLYQIEKVRLRYHREKLARERT